MAIFRTLLIGVGASKGTLLTFLVTCFALGAIAFHHWLVLAFAAGCVLSLMITHVRLDKSIATDYRLVRATFAEAKAEDGHDVQKAKGFVYDLCITLLMVVLVSILISVFA